MAAEHLLDRGLRHFGFVGYPDHAFSVGREAGFPKGGLARAGFTWSSLSHAECSGGATRGTLGLEQGLPRWLAWLLPTGRACLPVTIPQGVQVSEACRLADLRVPDDVAIVGVDDDDLLCELARPSLSSVALPSEQIGAEAAALLERLLNRQEAATRPDLASTARGGRASVVRYPGHRRPRCRRRRPFHPEPRKPADPGRRRPRGRARLAPGTRTAVPEDHPPGNLGRDPPESTWNAARPCSPAPNSPCPRSPAARLHRRSPALRGLSPGNRADPHGVSSPVPEAGMRTEGRFRDSPPRDLTISPSGMR